MRSGMPVNQNAVLHLASHPELFDLEDIQLAHVFKDLGFYSKKTYVLDIRVGRIREAALRLTIARLENGE